MCGSDVPWVAVGAFDTLMGKLEGVKRLARDRVIARCPAHEDRRPSLSVREANDGRVLIHCFAGCGAEEIVSAVGLELGDLFPPDDAFVPDKYSRTLTTKKVRKRVPASDALRMLDVEALELLHAARRIRREGRVDDRAMADLDLTCERIGLLVGDWLAQEWR